MLIYWCGFLVVVLVMFAHIMCLRRNCRAFRQDRDAQQEGYLRALKIIQSMQAKEQEQVKAEAASGSGVAQ
ncbi:hypothetical protein AAIG33_20080 [Phytobacter ursingii]|uniref:hypothetical protein n=1 Tax=Phytobacter ursingii TaxID=1972431 RepID=UPI000CD1C86E|nr:hypothetical protein C2U51_00270 [Enterobacteriaceae bacterium ENNIH1]